MLLVKCYYYFVSIYFAALAVSRYLPEKAFKEKCVIEFISPEIILPYFPPAEIVIITGLRRKNVTLALPRWHWTNSINYFSPFFPLCMNGYHGNFIGNIIDETNAIHRLTCRRLLSPFHMCFCFASNQCRREAHFRQVKGRLCQWDRCHTVTVYERGGNIIYFSCKIKSCVYVVESLFPNCVEISQKLHKFTVHFNAEIYVYCNKGLKLAHSLLGNHQ